MERLGLVVRRAPWQGRSGRDALDLALAAATLDLSLELFFIGDGVLQLVAGGEPGGAALPPGMKAWASLGHLAPTRFWAARDRLDALASLGVSWVLEPRPLAADAMPARQAVCDRLLVV